MKFKALIPLLGIAVVLPSISPASPYFTITKSSTASGPVSNAPGSSEQQYITGIFETLVKAADGIVKADSPTQNSYYWTFLLAALVVPNNESGLKHFQYLDELGNSCDEKENSGATLDASTRKVFNKYLKSSSDPFISDCSQMSKTSSAVQLLGSDDHLSVGLMQLTLDYHEDVYVAPGYYKSVADTAQIGLAQLYAGYSKIFHDFGENQYACLENSVNHSQINYTSLIRGTWGGPYNSGNALTSSVCRFANPNSQYASADVNFYKKFEEVVGRKSVFENLDGVDKDAFEEILNNFANHTNTHSAIDQILKGSSAYASSVPTQAPTSTFSSTLSSNDSVQKVASGANINLRSGPSSDASTCGNLANNTAVTVTDNIDDEDGENWSQIQPTTSSCNGAKVAYVLTSLLTDPASNAVAESSEDFSGTVTGDYVNVRTSAPSGKIIEVVKKGTVVKIIGSRKTSSVSNASWYQIGSNQGWISGRYISAE